VYSERRFERQPEYTERNGTAVAERRWTGDDGEVAAGTPPDRLSSDEVALVLRRAADLEAHAAGRPGADDGFDTAAVEEAAREVGLSPIAVRQALAELRTGVLVTNNGGRSIERTHPAMVKVARLVPKPPTVVQSTAESYLYQQTFEVRRRQDQTVLYRRRRDTAAKVRRAVDLNGVIQLDRVDAITLTATPVDLPETGESGETGESDRSMVHMVAELRSRAAVTSVANGVGLAVGGTTALIGLLLGAPAIAVGTLVVGAGVTVGEVTVRRKKLRRRRHQVAEVLDGLLDSLEAAPRLR
jgi:hypothetical protein